MMVFTAWLAAMLVFASFFMQTIVPLRTVAIFSNLAFITYALLALGQEMFAKVVPILVLHSALLPLNALRLWQVRRSIRTVRAMPGLRSAHDFLTRYMRQSTCLAGTVLFRQGDPAQLVYVLRRGTVHLLELNKTLFPGELFGEIAVFSTDARRTATAVCESDCELYTVSGEKILELFYQDQRFAFQIARSLSHYAKHKV